MALIALMATSSIQSNADKSCLSYVPYEGKKFCVACYNSIPNTKEPGCVQDADKYHCELAIMSSRASKAQNGENTDFDLGCLGCTEGYAYDLSSNKLEDACFKRTKTIDNCINYVIDDQHKVTGCQICQNQMVPDDNFASCQPSPPELKCDWGVNLGVFKFCARCIGDMVNFYLGEVARKSLPLVKGA